MQIVIPMAGRSERYFKAGYTLPKALLPVGKQTMIEAVVDCFDPKRDEFLFIINQDDEAHFGLGTSLGRLPINKRVAQVVLPDPPKGPVHTMLEVKDLIPAGQEIIVNYCDFLMTWDYKYFLKKIHDGNYDGGIPSFRGFQPASLGTTFYAYMHVDENNEFLELKEKGSFTDNRMQEHASTGTYYFKRWEYVLKYGGAMFASGSLPPGLKELYPSLLFNPMHDAGLRTLVYEVDKFICLGTPEDYREYTYWHDVFRTHLKKE